MAQLSLPEFLHIVRDLKASVHPERQMRLLKLLFKHRRLILASLNDVSAEVTREDIINLLIHSQEVYAYIDLP